MSGESALHRKMYYLDVSLEIPSDPNLTVSPVYLKKNILEAVRSLFGEEGVKSCPVDILKFSPEKRTFVLRCPYDSYVRLRSSLTLSTKYEGKTCVYTVHRASPNLLSFTADSRTFQHGEVPFNSSPCH
ncbi:PREDICTED: ribonuclease P protein subunit p14 [Cyphomyrmex costatus]|uniref:ribonuclease P protein subunit p14 n=1 Tax=Cyphomyrmex costatus TaxID=456900 RepID=UPI0008524557|nr:PREDICTED: ribonuclease P protein subunit p14 [Cyphomyrmex costatus]